MTKDEGRSDSTDMEPVAGANRIAVARDPGERSGSGPCAQGDLGADDWRRVFAALADGDERALETLYRATAGRVFGLALWRTGSVEDACDVVQEVFVRVAGQARRLGRVADPRGWLLGLSHHVAVDTVRRRRRQREAPLDEAPFLAAPEHDPTRAVDARRVTRLLGHLAPAQREAVYLKHYADCTFAEIGTIAGVPTFTAASRYRLGIDKLRRLLERAP